MTLATAGFERYAKTTRRAVFLAEMERVVPWPALCGLIEPFYPKAGNGRQRAVGALARAAPSFGKCFRPSQPTTGELGNLCKSHDPVIVI